MKLQSCTAALLLTLSIACTSNESKSADAGVAKTPDPVAQSEAPKPLEIPTATDESIKKMGLLKEVEDGGYPFATLTIEFPERKSKEYFSLNFEEVKGASLDKVYQWVGKYVSFTYNTDLTNALLDLQIGEKSLVSDEKIELGPEVKQLSGILKGANEETPGDLPGEVTITAKNKPTIAFPFFVTAEMVKANGKSVVGFYEERSQNTITAIRLLSK